MQYRTVATTTLLVLVSSLAFGISSTFEDKVSFLDHIGRKPITQNWGTYPEHTVIDSRTVDGIYYESSSSRTLRVGSPRGASWLLGYQDQTNRYTSFSLETISFVFSEAVESFGISFSQGNRSGGDSYEGVSRWSVLVDGTEQFYAHADYGLEDYTGEVFLGISGLEGATGFEFHRVSSDANISWNIRDITYQRSSIPENGSTAGALGLGIGLFAIVAKLSRTKQNKSNPLGVSP